MLIVLFVIKKRWRGNTNVPEMSAEVNQSSADHCANYARLRLTAFYWGFMLAI